MAETSSSHPHVTIHVISDALGDTACEVVLAAAGQFPESSVRMARLSKVSTLDQIERHLAPCIASGERIAVFYTIVDAKLRRDLAFTLSRLGIPAIDILGPALDTLASLLGIEPAGVPGVIHRTDKDYFNRIEAMEYFVEHDDGRGADDLSGADIVLLGVSRTSKTPLSMYLAFQGYRVANIPLATGLEPPSSIFRVDPMRLFGLLSTVDVIASIRDRRLGDAAAHAVASSYADPGAISRELDEAHALMRRLGCFIVRTDNRAIEESAAEIIGRLELVREARRARARNS